MINLVSLNTLPKRINFISIQNSSTIAAEGYEISPVCTGYEKVIAHRCSSIFASAARGDGVVSEVRDDFMQIDYDNPMLGSDRIQLGLRHGTVAGMTLPHRVVTDLTEGARVTEDDIVSWNTAFFIRDPLEPTQVIYLPGTLARTMLIENCDTLEDSSVIDDYISNKLRTSVTYPRTIVLNFDQAIHNLVSVGDTVDIDSILCNIEDAITANSGMFDDQSYDMLKVLSRSSPRAKHSGRIDKIDVVYRGDVEDMSESLAAVAIQADRERARLAKRLQRGPKSGKAVTDVRLKGTQLENDQIAITVYITHVIPAEVGDKGVFANQLKTTFGRKMNGINMTEDGLAINAIFGYQSVSNRIVNSPELLGPANSILVKGSELIVAAYDS